ncbi:hypothetical protein H4683_003560 [Filibacter limicola]|uniref:Uncharacterized protein n=1 Tax=Sporosarcina limicola TaxID=34101 RepID=A0A927ML89_9BACL|nr:hypothetical protein [Sporosarcina limicola]
MTTTLLMTVLLLVLTWFLEILKVLLIYWFKTLIE